MLLKGSSILVALYLLMALAIGNVNAQQNGSESTHGASTPNRMPLVFTKNMGQWDDRVLFRTDAGGATMWFTKDGVTYQFARHIGRSTRRVSSTSGVRDSLWANAVRPYDPDGRDSIEQLVITAKFIGANPNVEVVGEGLIEYKCNYFLGNDPANWRTDVPSYKALTLRNIFEGVDLQFFDDADGRLTYRYEIAPGIPSNQVILAYQGANKATIDAAGLATANTKLGSVSGLLAPPTAAIDSVSGESAFLMQGATDTNSDGETANYHSPGAVTLIYSTFLGGTGGDTGNGIAVDVSGNAYVTGRTSSLIFPTENAYDASQNESYDVFVTKFSAVGNTLIYSTYLGGSDWDEAYGIALDEYGHVYVTGVTRSSDFPNQDSFDDSLIGGQDAFVTKFSVAGNAIIYSSFLGGENSDDARSIAVDGSGCVYVTGFTTSPGFPTENPIDANYNGHWDVFVTKFSETGGALVYSTFLGGEDHIEGYGYESGGSGIVVDSFGCAYVTGKTPSSDFPTQNAFDASYNGGLYDGFVTKLSAAGNTLIYSTFLGGEGYDECKSIAVDGFGCAYVTGSTPSSNFPIQNAFDNSHNGGGDVFVTKLSAEGNALVYSTFLGGPSPDLGFGLAVDGLGCAYVTGTTYSGFPTMNAYDMSYDSYSGATDAFLSKLSASGNVLVYSTYLGGTSADFGRSIAVGEAGCAYVTGGTGSLNFPTLNAFDAERDSGGDVFVTKLSAFNIYTCGDFDASSRVNVADAVYLISYIFASGPVPQDDSGGDIDCSGRVNIADIVYLISYIFSGGAAPCAACS